MKKALIPTQANYFEQIPNIGKAIANDFKLIGIKKPADLRNKDPYQLYISLCEKTKSYHDPCVLDTFISAVYFMNGKGAKSWWTFTAGRKKKFQLVNDKVKKWK